MKDRIKNLYQNILVASRDRVDLVMFGVIIFFCFKPMEGIYPNLAFGFVAFYVFFLLIRLAELKRMLKNKSV